MTTEQTQHARDSAELRRLCAERDQLRTAPPSPDAELVELLRSKFPRIDPCQPVPLDEKAHCCEYTIKNSGCLCGIAFPDLAGCRAPSPDRPA